MDLDMTDASRPAPKKRRRPALACAQCRARKVRCDRTSPCSNCIKSRIPDCTYISSPRDRTGSGVVAATDSTRIGHPASGADPGLVTTNVTTQGGDLHGSYLSSRYHDTVRGPEPFLTATVEVPSGIHRHNPGTPSAAPSSSSSTSLLQRIQRLEAHLDERNSSQGATSLRSEPPTRGEYAGPSAALPLRNMHHKTRLFGRSHWMNGADLLPVLLGVFNRAMKDSNSAIFRADLECKALGRSIKAGRIPTLIFPLIQIGQAIGQKAVADLLIDCYLRTSETIHRVVHIPTFRSEYEEYWASPQAANPAFVVLVQLCMAIGACFLDDDFSLRSEAIRWIYEAELWLVLPSDAIKMTFISLQIRCLLKIGRQITGLGSDLTWISVGSLLRAAMYMGLHRDPAHSNAEKRTRLNSEMRRRLWATILEINLQDSIDSGGSPLISMADFDTGPPGNFDDAQLSTNGEDLTAAASAPGVYTSTTVQIALYASFPTRLAIAKALNEFQSGLGQDDVLRLSSQLTASAQTLQQQLTTLTGDGPNLVSDFQLRSVALLVDRFFLVLHIPLLSPGLDNPTHHFSHKACLDTALKVCQISGLMHGTGRSRRPSTDFGRLITSASGLRKTTVFQSIMMVAWELTSRKEEERKRRGFSVSLGDAELRSTIEAAVPWTQRSITAGETNCKGYAALRAILAHIDGLETGLGGAELNDKIEAAAAEALLECYQLMKDTPAGQAVGSQTSSLHSQDAIAQALDDDSMEMGMFYDWENLSHVVSPEMPLNMDGIFEPPLTEMI